jgi:hypothetical protein
VLSYGGPATARITCLATVIVAYFAGRTTDWTVARMKEVSPLPRTH